MKEKDPNKILQAEVDRLSAMIVKLVCDKQNDKSDDKLRLDIFIAYYVLEGMIKMFKDVLDEDVLYDFWKLAPLLQNLELETLKVDLLIKIHNYGKNNKEVFNGKLYKVL